MSLHGDSSVDRAKDDGATTRPAASQRPQHGQEEGSKNQRGSSTASSLSSLLRSNGAGGLSLGNLSSYTSEPPQTLLLLRQWAQEEEAAQLAQRRDSPTKKLRRRRQHSLHEGQPLESGRPQQRSYSQGGDALGIRQGSSEAPTSLLGTPTGSLELSPTANKQPFGSSVNLVVRTSADRAAEDGGADTSGELLASLLDGDSGHTSGPPSPLQRDVSLARSGLLMRTNSTLRAGVDVGLAQKAQRSQQAAAAQQGGAGRRRRLGVELLGDPLAEEWGVSNHRTAGGLFLVRPSNNDRGKAKDGGYKLAPLPPDEAKAVLLLDSPRKAKPITRSSHPDNAGGNDDLGDQGGEEDIDIELGEEDVKGPLYKRPAFIKGVFWGTLTLALTLTGIFLGVWQTDERLASWFQWWRLCIFLATLIPIWWIGTYFGRAIIWVTEGSRFFTMENILYFVYSLRKPLVNVLRSVLALSSWAACMYEPDFNKRSRPDTGQFYDAYIVILKLWGCVSLFFVAELLKILFAKLIASKFNRESHVKKMQAALRQERYLMALLQAPERRRRAQDNSPPLDDADDTSADGDDSTAGDDKGDGSGGGATDALGGKRNGGTGAGGRRLVKKGSGRLKASASEPAGLGSSLGRKSSLQSLLGWWGGKPESEEAAAVRDPADMLQPIPEEHGGGAVVLDIDHPPASTPRLHSMSPVPALATQPPEASPGGSFLGAGTFTHPLQQPATPRGIIPAVTVERWEAPITPSSRVSPQKPHQSQQQPEPGTPLGSRLAPLKLRQRSPLGRASPSGGGGGGGDTARGVSGSARVGCLERLSNPRTPRTARAPSESGGRGGGVKRGSMATAAGVERSIESAAAGGGGKESVQNLKKELPSAESMHSSLLNKGPVAVAAKLSRVEKHIRKNALQITFYDELSGQRREKVTNEAEAKRLAFYLFYTVKEDFSRPYITIDDLEDILEEKEAQEAYKMLDKDGNGRVTLAECADAVINVFKDREYLATSLRDTKNIVGKLGFMIGVGLHIMMFFIYLLILGVDAWQVFVAVVPVLGALSFAIGSSVKQAVDNSIFLFVTHPFDVGDIVVFNDVGYQVEEITLPCTVLLRTTDSAKIWYPNAMLITTPLHNVTVSPPLGDLATFIVDATTPLDVAEKLKDAVTAYVADRSQDFKQTVSVWWDLSNDPTRPNKLALKISVSLTYNGLNPRCYPERGKYLHFVLNKLHELGVEVTNVVQPVVSLGQGPLVLGAVGGTSSAVPASNPFSKKAT